MDKKKTTKAIVEKEWKMFHTVNGEDRVSCQEDQETFEAMRTAQFSVWSEAAAEAYLIDLERAESEMRNLVREKYIWMMKSSAQNDFEQLKDQLPTISSEKAALVKKLWDHFLTQTERMRQKYPVLAVGGRPLHAAEEELGQTSIESYQTGELLTYSDTTLRLLLEHMIVLEKQGVDMAFEIQKNSVLCMGYQSMEEAEAAMARQLMLQMGGAACGDISCIACQG